MGKQPREMAQSGETSTLDRKRRDPRGEVLRTALIEAAEILFAEHGMDGVSLREIGKAAGSENTGVVSYYFGGKKQLIKAIYNHRLPMIEKRRTELLADAAGLEGPEELRSLLRASFLPVFEQKDPQGRSSYASFLASLGRSIWSKSRKNVADLYPVSEELMARLQKFVPGESRVLLEERMKLVTIMIVSAINTAEATGTPAEKDEAKERWFLDALTMATAAITAVV